MRKEEGEGEGGHSWQCLLPLGRPPLVRRRALQLRAATSWEQLPGQPGHLVRQALTLLGEGRLGFFLL